MNAPCPTAKAAARAAPVFGGFRRARAAVRPVAACPMGWPRPSPAHLPPAAAPTTSVAALCAADRPGWRTREAWRHLRMAALALPLGRAFAALLVTSCLRSAAAARPVLWRRTGAGLVAKHAYRPLLAAWLANVRLIVNGMPSPGNCAMRGVPPCACHNARAACTCCRAGHHRRQECAQGPGAPPSVQNSRHHARRVLLLRGMPTPPPRHPTPPSPARLSAPVGHFPAR